MAKGGRVDECRQVGCMRPYVTEERDLAFRRVEKIPRVERRRCSLLVWSTKGYVDGGTKAMWHWAYGTPGLRSLMLLPPSPLLSGL